MDGKLFKKTYPYICSKCFAFSHTMYDFCGKCGAEASMRKAEKEDYKNHHK